MGTFAPHEVLDEVDDILGAAALLRAGDVVERRLDQLRVRVRAD